MIGRIPILDVTPSEGCGRWPAKAVVGETFTVSATVFREGHDAVNANVVLRDPRGRKGPLTPMLPGAPGTDRWSAEVTPTSSGRWSFVVEAWSDPFATWHHNAEIKIAAGIDVELMLEEGALVLERAAKTARPAAGRRALIDAAKALRDDSRPVEARLAPVESPEVVGTLTANPLREFVTTSERLPLWVDRERALFSSWYEFFPRSEGVSKDPETGVLRAGTFRTAMERLPAVAAMGFDVVYLPPIHPIGTINRKGPNNTLDPGPDDVGSPWAIGSAEGGHDAIHRDLGTIEDFDAFVARAKQLGLEVALDYALQVAPDHPWAKEHPEWFTILADGTIAYAENPPKKYQDIYPINFDKDPDGIYAECLRVLRHWMSHGVRIFRVDNPHTKPVSFWAWMMDQVRETDPDVLFLAEAFTRPAMMQTLARVGFHQSYTYFTWRNEKWEIEEYLTELSTEDRPFPAAQLLRQHSRHPARLPAVRRPAGVQDPGRPGRDPLAVVGRLLRLRALRARRGPAGQRGVPRHGEVPAPPARLGRGRGRRAHPGAVPHAAQRRAPSPPRTPAAAEPDVPRHRQRPDHRLLQARRRRRHRPRDRQPRPARRARDHGPPQHAGARAAVARQLRGAGRARRGTFLWWEHNYVRLDPFIEPAHLFTVGRTGT